MSTSLTKTRQQLESMKASRRRERAEQKQMGHRATRIGVGFGVATVNGFIMQKAPRLASFDAAGKVPTAPVLAFAAGLGAVFSTDESFANGLEGVATGLGLPYGSQLGAQIAGKVG